MNYTEEEILDLEEALSTAGLEERTSFGILAPGEFPKDRVHCFSSTVIRDHGKELAGMGLDVRGSILGWVSNGETVSTSVSCLRIEGPRLRAHREALRIGELYNCDQIIEFVE
jgi:hypothetical protein